MSNQSVGMGLLASEAGVGSPGVVTDAFVTVGGVASGVGTVPGPGVGGTGGPAPPAFTPRISASAHDLAGVLRAGLGASFARTWQDELNGPGTGSVSVLNSDPELGMVRFSDVVRFSLDGQARFAALVEKMHRVTVAPGEEADQVTVISGRGTLAVMERAVVRPDFGAGRALYQDVRRFDFGSPDLDDSGWGAAVQSEQGKGSLAGVRPGAPEGWPDDLAWWIWDRPSPVGAGDPPVPVGDVYFRTTLVTPAGDGQLVGIFASCDNQYSLVVDGVVVMEDQSTGGFGWGQTKRVDVFLAPGTHQFAVKATNSVQVATTTANPAGLLLAVYELSQVLIPTSVLLRSSSSWRVLGYPSAPPGFTPGAVVRVLVAEAQADGAIPGLVTSFDDFVDSAGRAWPTTPDIAFRVGLDLLSVLAQLTEVYLDAAMAVGSLTLNAFVVSGTTRATVLTPGVNLSGLSHDGSV